MRFLISLFCFVAVAKCIDFDCPRVCRCDQRRHSVFCNDRGLEYVPVGIPETTKTLRLQGNGIISSLSLENSLMKLRHLKKLYLHNNRLTSFPKHLPSSLEYLSMNNNEIKYIGRNALAGMSKLLELQLGSNNITDNGIARTAFDKARKLQELGMTSNLLSSIPVKLPPALQLLRLDHNRIDTVSEVATSSLTGLYTLDLSNNRIQNVDVNSLSQLTSLRSLNLARNQMTQVPRSLPLNLSELHLSHNKIKYVTVDEMSGLEKVSKLDLSSNELESVERDTFANLNSLHYVELHDNPWRCDCYLTYLKRWLTNTTSVVSSEQNVQCRTPDVFSEVTIGSIDLEALRCNDDHANNIVIAQIEAHSAIVQYEHNQFDPPYLRYMVMYGPLKCSNCSILNMSPLQRATDTMATYDVTDLHASNTTLSRLSGDSAYVVCVYNTYVSEVKLSSCKEVRTGSAKIEHEIADSFPTWVILLGCSVIFLLLVICITWRIRRKRQLLNEQQTTKNYQKCWLYASTTTLDARQEFEVAIRPRPVVTSHRSLCSDVISTTNTGMTGITSEHGTLPRRPMSYCERHNTCYDMTINEEQTAWRSSHSTDLNDTGIYV